MEVYSGTVDIPAACPVATSQLVAWSSGEPILTQGGEVHDLPMFFDVDASYSSPTAAQPVYLALSTDDAMDEKVHILSFRFTFY